MPGQRNRRVLVVATRLLSESVVHDLVDEEAETIVIVPAVRQTRLEWLTNDEDPARGAAERAAQRLADESPGLPVAARAGDPDPVLAVQDALREFPADEIILVTTVGEGSTWLERRASEISEATSGGVPITRATLDDSSPFVVERNPIGDP